MLAPRLCVHFMKERNSLKYLVAFSFQMCFWFVRSMCYMVSSRKPFCLCARVMRTHACLWSCLPAQGPGWMLFLLRTWERTLAAALPSRPVSAVAGTPWPKSLPVISVTGDEHQAGSFRAVSFQAKFSRISFDGNPV